MKAPNIFLNQSVRNVIERANKYINLYLQEKAELHQKAQGLELQLQREQRGKKSFNEQVCELHTELSQAKNQANRQKKDTIFMKDELLSMKEVRGHSFPMQTNLGHVEILFFTKNVFVYHPIAKLFVFIARL